MRTEPWFAPRTGGTDEQAGAPGLPAHYDYDLEVTFEPTASERFGMRVEDHAAGTTIEANDAYTSCREVIRCGEWNGCPSKDIVGVDLACWRGMCRVARDLEL